MFEALLPILFLGLFQVPAPADSSVGLLQSLQIAPPVAELTQVAHTSASGIVVIDTTTGQVVYSKDPDTRRPMASITKLMTALIIVENHELSEVVQIPQIATAIPGQKAYFEAYDQFTVGDLLSALLITSANDAAVALAIHHSGSVEAFVEQMNARAQVLGLKNTSYANPTGLDSVGQYSTASDIAWLTAHVYNIPSIAERMQKRSDTIISQRGNAIHLYHTHSSLHKNALNPVSNALVVHGGKTGTTDNAKQCLVSLVGTNQKEYIVVVLHSENRYGDLTKLMSSLESNRVLGYTTPSN